MKKIMIITAFLLAGLITELSAQQIRPYNMRKNNLYGKTTEAREYKGNTFANRKHNLSGKTQQHEDVETKRRNYAMRRNNLSGNISTTDRTRPTESRFHKRRR